MSVKWVDYVRERTIRNHLMYFTWIIIAAVYLILTHVVAEYIGKRRKIGYGRIILWSLLLSPVIGLIIALTSPRIKGKYNTNLSGVERDSDV